MAELVAGAVIVNNSANRLSPPVSEGSTFTGITGDHRPTYWPPAGGPPAEAGQPSMLAQVRLFWGS